MPTFIKPGFWEKAKKGYKDWLNLDLLIESKIPVTPTPTLPYKVYTALLTQSGGDTLSALSFDDTPGGPDFIIGVTYQIVDNTVGLDVTNIGAPNNEVGTYFVATGTRPANWGEGSLIYNTGAPVVTVLENTLGNVWFTYVGIGQYLLISNGLFVNNKSWYTIFTGDLMNNSLYQEMFIDSVSVVSIQSFGDTITANGVLTNVPIEIRVYN